MITTTYAVNIVSPSQSFLPLSFLLLVYVWLCGKVYPLGKILSVAKCVVWYC